MKIMEFLEEYLISSGDQESESQDLEAIWSFSSLDALATSVQMNGAQRSEQVLREFLISDGSDGPNLGNSNLSHANTTVNSECTANLTTLTRHIPPQIRCRQATQNLARRPVPSDFSKQFGEGVQLNSWSSSRESSKTGDKIPHSPSQKSSFRSRDSDAPLTPPSSCDSDSSPSPLPDRLNPSQCESEVTKVSGEQHCGKICSDAAAKPTACKVIIPLKDPNPLKLKLKSASQSSGRLVQLTDEEKKLLVQEGLPVPVRYPLTKTDERNLKRIRRKIKNKISAQESRRKKKEYVETLEDQIKQLEKENSTLKDKLEIYDKTNRNLIGELKQVKAKFDAISSGRFGSTLSDLISGDSMH